MDDGKLTMELFRNKNSGNKKFESKTKGLEKKLNEFSTLCGVDACMVMFVPKQVQPIVWPGNSDDEQREVQRIINMYRDHQTEKKTNINLCDSLKHRKKKAQEKLAMLGATNEKLKKHSKKDWIEYCFPKTQLKEVVSRLVVKIQDVKAWIELMENHSSMDHELIAPKTIDFLGIESSDRDSDHHGSRMSTLSMKGKEQEVQIPQQQQQPPIQVVPMMQQYPTDHGHHDQPLRFSPTPMAGVGMMMMIVMNNGHSPQMGGGTYSTSNVHQCIPLINGPILQAPMMPAGILMLENVMFNNNIARPPPPYFCYAAPIVQPVQVLPAAMQQPAMPDVSSQLHPTQVNESDHNELFDP